MISYRQSILLVLALACINGFSFERALALTQDIPIVVLAGSDQQQPTISNNWLAWEDARSSNGVFGVRAKNGLGGTEFWVSPDPGSAYYVHPRLSGDALVFQGNPGAKGFLFYDSLADASPVKKVYDQTINQGYGDIDGNLIIWSEESSDPSAIGSNLYGSYLGSNSKFPISTDSNVFYAPVTDGRFVAWTAWADQNHLSTYARDLQTNTTTLLHTQTKTDFGIDNGIVAYGIVGGVGVNNLLTNQSFTIPAPPTFSVTVSGNLIVYSAKPSGKSDYDLFGVRLPNLQPFVISDAPGDQLWAAVNGNFVVWTDSRNGDYDLYGTFVPEPGTVTLVACALVCGSFARRRS